MPPPEEHWHCNWVTRIIRLCADVSQSEIRAAHNIILDADPAAVTEVGAILEPDPNLVNLGKARSAITITPSKAAALLDGFENLANSGSGSGQHRGKITAGEIVVQICNVCNRWTTHTVRAEPGLYNHAACRRCGSRSHDRTRKDEPAYYRGTLP